MANHSNISKQQHDSRSLELQSCRNIMGWTSYTFAKNPAPPK